MYPAPRQVPVRVRPAGRSARHGSKGSTCTCVTLLDMRYMPVSSHERTRKVQSGHRFPRSVPICINNIFSVPNCQRALSTSHLMSQTAFPVLNIIFPKRKWRPSQRIYSTAPNRTQRCLLPVWPKLYGVNIVGDPRCDPRSDQRRWSIGVPRSDGRPTDDQQPTSDRPATDQPRPTTDQARSELVAEGPLAGSDVRDALARADISRTRPTGDQATNTKRIKEVPTVYGSEQCPTPSVVHGVRSGTASVCLSVYGRCTE